MINFYTIPGTCSCPGRFVYYHVIACTCSLYKKEVNCRTDSFGILVLCCESERYLPCKD